MVGWLVYLNKKWDGRIMTSFKVLPTSHGGNEENTETFGQSIRSSDWNLTPEYPENKTIINHTRR
jgi:hypothetical protein